MKRAIAVSAIALGLAGCSQLILPDPTKPATHWVRIDELLPSQDAKVVFYRPAGKYQGWFDARIDVNGNPACPLSSSQAYVYDSPPGNLAIVARYWEAYPAPAPISIHVEANRVYYVRVAGEPGQGTDIVFSVVPVPGKPPADDGIGPYAYVCTPYQWR